MPNEIDPNQNGAPSPQTAMPPQPVTTPPTPPVAPLPTPTASVVTPATPTLAPTPSPTQPAPTPAQQTPTLSQSQPQSAPQRPGQLLRPGMPTKPGTIRKPPNPKNLIIGCGGCSGLAILSFIIFVLIFVSQTSATGENPLARALGMNTATFINNMILMVNLIFAGIFTLLFLLAIIGLFRFGMARKDDKENRKKGITLAAITGLFLFVLIVLWIGVYLYLDSKKVNVTTGPVAGIVTEPARTLGLTAPVTITFDASYAPIDARQYDILSYNWAFGDGTSSTVALTSHTFTDKGPNDGRYDVQLQIAKLDKQTGQEVVDTYTQIVTIANVELSSVFTATPEKGPAPLTINFDASQSRAPAGQITSYEWDFDNNNVFTDASGVQSTYTFNQVGTYRVNLRVTDNTGQFKVGSKDIIVEGANIPTAVIDVPTTTGKYFVGQNYTFQAEKSTSPNGSIQKFEWDFGDGSPKANTRTANHSYKTTGEYEIILKVTDEQGKVGETAQKIKLETAESAPLAVIETVPAPNKDEKFIEGPVPFEVAFDGKSSQDSDNNIVDYQWDFDGDGTIDTAGQQVTFVYKTEGVYNATLTVTDAEKNESNAVIVVRVSSQPLQARITATPVEGVYPLTVTFDASSSSYPSGQIVSYEWEFGDGGPKRIDAAQVTHKYTQVGTFIAKVTAIASDNSKSTAETPINVRPIALTACFTASPESGASPLTVEFDPYCSTGTIAKYSWDFGNGKTTLTRKPTQVYDQPGSYTVKLEVTDNQNVVSQYEKNILVTGNI